MNVSEDLFLDKKLNEKIKILSKEFSFDVCKITKPNLDKKIQKFFYYNANTTTYVTFFLITTYSMFQTIKKKRLNAFLQEIITWKKITQKHKTFSSLKKKKL